MSTLPNPDTDDEDTGRGKAMRFHRARTLRRICYATITTLLIWLFVHFETGDLPRLSFSPTGPQEAVYLRRPVYEYTSLYRTRANVTFEEELEGQLVKLEQDVWSKLREEERDLRAEKRIWQITSPELAEVWKSWTVQWRDNNKEWEHKLFTSMPDDLLPIFESIPVIVQAERKFPGIREDLIRYLVLWYYGGFWTAVDTWDRVAMRDCAPIVDIVEEQRDVSLVVGVDEDEAYLSPTTMRRWGWTRGFGFSQAVMFAPRRFDPLLRRAISRTISHAMTQEGLPKGSWSQRQLSKIGGKVDYSSEVGGAGMFTDIILEALSKSLEDDHSLRDRDAGLEKRVTWKKFRHLTDILWLEKSQYKDESEDLRGLAVLPINVWGSGQTHSRSGSSESEDACVNHVHGWRPKKHTISFS